MSLQTEESEPVFGARDALLMELIQKYVGYTCYRTPGEIEGLDYEFLGTEGGTVIKGKLERRICHDPGESFSVFDGAFEFRWHLHPEDSECMVVNPSVEELFGHFLVPTHKSTHL